MNHAEDRLHKSIWQQLQHLLPDDAVPQSFENRQNGPIEGRRRKERGCLPGWPDMGIVWNSRTYYIELKTATGRLNPAQKACHARLRAAGAPVAVCRSLEDVLYFLETHDVPLKGAVMA
ncbi:VRR-NUC domain-containing protein [Acetobacter senegalensis]|uniref:VRR-NUC domain-containing protein n=1 Tax=Acetobacter senegalensis TaxID=446692 RepID=UPI001EDFEF4A|nr:VRR-NUC domain-containing protein [Acetobacter senegalensis]MCG4273917.1 VRR-NUC domain-containing protein [Acetobacter senegalensis]